MPWPDCAPCHSLPDGGGGNRPPSGQPNVPANSRQSGLRVPLAASSPRYLALTNIRRRSQSLPAATEDRHRPPSTPNRARTIALPCPYRPFRCCIVIPSVDLGLGVITLAHDTDSVRRHSGWSPCPPKSAPALSRGRLFQASGFGKETAPKPLAGALHQKSFQGEGVLTLPPALGVFSYLGTPQAPAGNRRFPAPSRGFCAKPLAGAETRRVLACAMTASDRRVERWTAGRRRLSRGNEGDGDRSRRLCGPRYRSGFLS